MTCQKELIALHMPYPRTCGECGLGPCKNGYGAGWLPGDPPVHGNPDVQSSPSQPEQVDMQWRKAYTQGRLEEQITWQQATGFCNPAEAALQLNSIEQFLGRRPGESLVDAARRVEERYLRDQETTSQPNVNTDSPHHPIQEHEGKKYLRSITSATKPHTAILVDVYSVLNAFNVVDPAVAHAVKKLLCCGQRGKGDRLADLMGVLAAVNRAVDLEQQEAGIS